jgi:hypothetical protein
MPTPRVIWNESPILVETWCQDHQEQIHLVNYNHQPQTIQISFGSHRSGKIISPDQNETAFSSSQLKIDLDIYAILLIDPSENK